MTYASTLRTNHSTVLLADKLQKLIQVGVLGVVNKEDSRLSVGCRYPCSLPTVILLARPNVGEGLVLAQGSRR